MEHTRSEEYCLNCDAAYKSYACMIAPLSEPELPPYCRVVYQVRTSVFETENLRSSRSVATIIIIKTAVFREFAGNCSLLYRPC